MENKTVMKNKSTITIAILTLLVATFTLSAQPAQAADITKYHSPVLQQDYNYSPKEVFNSPFVQSDYNSGVIKLKTKELALTLDFNDEI
jgi:hypothetical protein